jgi:hypothetical protein
MQRLAMRHQIFIVGLSAQLTIAREAFVGTEFSHIFFRAAAFNSQ